LELLVITQTIELIWRGIIQRAENRPGFGEVASLEFDTEGMGYIRRFGGRPKEIKKKTLGRHLGYIGERLNSKP